MTESPVSELKACPFCKQHLIKIGAFSRRNADCFVHPQDVNGVDYGRCPAVGFRLYTNDPERITAWNTRQDTPPADHIAEVGNMIPPADAVGVDLDALEKVARAVTSAPGDWIAQTRLSSEVGDSEPQWMEPTGKFYCPAGYVDLTAEDVATHIPTFDPPTVLKLIALARLSRPQAADEGFGASGAVGVVALTDELVAEVMQDTWNDICADTDCHPLDIKQLGRRRLSFTPLHWSSHIAGRLRALLSSPRQEDPAQGRALDVEEVARIIEYYVAQLGYADKAARAIIALSNAPEQPVVHADLHQSRRSLPTSGEVGGGS